MSDTAPRTDAAPTLKSRLLLGYQRLALSWHAVRYGRGRAVALRRDGGLLSVDDGMRRIYVPHARRANCFRNGVNAWLESVAEKYIGGTGYVPREGDIIVDVGAGIGEFTLWCADANARVTAFEPDPLAFACLEKNAALLSGVSVFQCALWKERANLLHGSVDASESSLIEDDTNSRNVDVEAWPLDQLEVLIRLPVIDFMKVDGEGVEPEILAGGARTLRRTRVIAVDVGATSKRPKLKSRVELLLESQNFRRLPHDNPDTILALNTAMVGPFSTRAFGRRSS
jgi:FkbM family methyltransferase